MSTCEAHKLTPTPRRKRGLSVAGTASRHVFLDPSLVELVLEACVSLNDVKLLSGARDATRARWPFETLSGHVGIRAMIARSGDDTSFENWARTAEAPKLSDANIAAMVEQLSSYRAMAASGGLLRQLCPGCTQTLREGLGASCAFAATAARSGRHKGDSTSLQPATTLTPGRCGSSAPSLYLTSTGDPDYVDQVSACPLERLVSFARRLWAQIDGRRPDASRQRHAAQFAVTHGLHLPQDDDRSASRKLSFARHVPRGVRRRGRAPSDAGGASATATNLAFVDVLLKVERRAQAHRP
ncbi:hypothetical protein JL720_13029 [Aureococcus anophagefferens]|nr:hypothetical protein JL720_13029 [Aureococcus anophagefferens]